MATTTASDGDDASGLVTGLAQQFSALESAVARQAERFGAIIELSAQISSARDIDELLRTVMDRLTTLLEAEAATLFMYDEQTNELWSRVLKGSGAALREIRIGASLGIAGHVFSTGKALCLGDAYLDERFNPDIDRRSGFRTRSIIAAPLKHVSGRLLGVLQVLHRKVDAFSREDCSLVEGMASQVAAVLENVRLVESMRLQSEELARKVNDLDALYATEKAISRSDDQTELLDGILKTATQLLEADAGSILIIEEERDSLYFRSARGEKSDALRSYRLKRGQGIAGYVTQSDTVVRVAKAEDSPHHDKNISKRLGIAAAGSVLCVPVKGEGHHMLGALELLNKPGGFTEGDERLAVLLAGQVGRALVRKQSQEEEERRARLASIGQMIAGVLHDLRTPLTVISGYAEMLIDEKDPAVRSQFSKSILSQVDHVTAMQGETLAFVRGERSLFKRKVFLHLYMRELESQLQQELAATAKGVELKLELLYSGTARFDESKLTRAIFNLARNAVDAMGEEGGKLTLQVAREKGDVIFRAIDTGPGIPEEIADRVFESFVTSGKKNGTGLGLAMVRSVAKEHEGDVTFKSKPGKGTTFEIRFPAGTETD